MVAQPDIRSSLKSNNMLCWITTDFTYRKQLVNVVSQQTIVIRNKYMSYTELVLMSGDIVKPITLKWVKREAFKLPEKTI